MKCPECGVPQNCSTSMVPGVEVFRCRGCSTFRIKGDDNFIITGGSGVMDRIRSRAFEVLARHRHQEMIESDSDDPRWEKWTQ